MCFSQEEFFQSVSGGVLLGTLIYSVLAAGVGVYLTPYLNLSICRFYLLATGNQAGGAEPPHTDPWDTQF